MTSSSTAVLEQWLVRHRAELALYCYRMLGSPFEAEDAVQETVVRALRKMDRFDEGRGSLRTWLYAIATNICLDMLRGAGRRARAMDLGPASAPEAQLGAPLPEQAWVQPVPTDPADVAVRRETVRLAFVAALQHLPPRQRAVLILRDVLGWKAAEVAELLEVSAASVNSALQRARSTLDAGKPVPPEPMDRVQRDLLGRYVEAFERYDMEALVALLHEDATMSMPPFGWWLQGRAEIRKALIGAAGACRDNRLAATTANGSPAYGQYHPDGSGFALIVLEVGGDRITEMCTYLNAARLFPLFGLPARLDR